MKETENDLEVMNRDIAYQFISLKEHIQSPDSGALISAAVGDSDDGTCVKRSEHQHQNK